MSLQLSQEVLHSLLSNVEPQTTPHIGTPAVPICITHKLALSKLSHNTIKSHLAAVRHLHIAEGLAEPEISKMARLEQVL